MSSFRPTAQHERWMAAAANLDVPADTPWLVERSGGWKRLSLLTRCAFFVLGFIAAGLTAGIFYLMKFPGPMFVAGLMAVVAGETLIAKRKLFGGGLEEGLVLSGLVLMLVQVLEATSTLDDATAPLFLAIALALAGTRLLNALFFTLAAVALSYWVYSASRVDPYDYSSASTVTSVFCFVIAAVALAGGAKQFIRPSIDRILDWLVITMPVAGYAWLADGYGQGPTFTELGNNPIAALPLLLIASFTAAALAIGIKRRRHAPLLAAMAGIGCIAYELRNLTGLPLELRLIMWGSLALLVTLTLIAMLRKPRNGITSTEIETGSGALQLLELAGVSSLTPVQQSFAPNQPGHQGGGGEFGGGGAGGKF
jgi:hypothetical protein